MFVGLSRAETVVQWLYVTRTARLGGVAVYCSCGLLFLGDTVEGEMVTPVTRET